MKETYQAGLDHLQGWRDKIEAKYNSVADSRLGRGVAWVGRSGLGTSLKRGAAESFGWSYVRNAQGTVINEGFLGWRQVGREAIADNIDRAFASQGRELTDRAKAVTKGLRDPGQLGTGAGKSMTKKAMTRAVMRGGATGVAKAGLRTVMKGIPLLSTVYFAYEGYKENGVAGALGSAAFSVGSTTALHALGMGLSNPLFWAATAVVAGGVGAYAAGENAQAYRRGLRKLEMGSNVVDPFQTAATLRQRSLTALQNSKINGRMGLGNEALIMHRSF